MLQRRPVWMCKELWMVFFATLLLAMGTVHSLAAEVHVMMSAAELRQATGTYMDLTADPDRWRSIDQITPLTWDDGALLFRGASSSRPLGAQTIIELNQTEPAPITFAAESRAVGVPGQPDVEYSLWADVHFTDGTPAWGMAIIPFPTDSPGWEYRELTITPPKPVATINLHVLVRREAEAVWFRNVTLYETSDRGTFDGEAVEVIARHEQPKELELEQVEADGLRLTFAANGRITEVAAQGRATTSPGFGGFMIKDVFAESGYYAGETRVSRIGERVRLDSEYPDMGLRLNAEVTPHASYIEVTGTVSDTTGNDRGLVVYFALPMSAVGWTWWNDITHSVPVQNGAEYANLIPLRDEVGATGSMSVYPVAAISGTANVAMAIAGDDPRVARLGYSTTTNQFYIAFDLGLAPETSPPSAADFRFYIYTFDGQWGYRAAWDRYMKIESERFATNLPRQGIWMPFSSIETVRDWQDFGFGFHELGNVAQAAFARQQGILSFIYEEPHTYWMPIPLPLAERTYDRILAVLRSSQRVLNRPEAYATEASALHDRHGSIRVEALDMPWNQGAVFPLNPNPHLPGIDGHANRGQLAYNPDSPHWDQVDGAYFDSIEVEHRTTLLNYRREHFAYAKLPLIYDRYTKQVALLQAASIYEFLSSVRDDLDSKGKYMMLNSTPYKFWWFTMLSDISGTETGWIGGDGAWNPPRDRDLAYLRTLSGPKPYVLLQNIRFELTDTAFVEKYFQRALFYGIYPSMFSHDAASDPYWENPTFYNRDRELFKKYIPVITEVASAGWQPVTLATTLSDAVRVERFGEGRSVYFTVYNFSTQAQRGVTLIVPLDQLGMETSVQVIDLLSGEEVIPTIRRSAIIVPLDMPAQTVRVFKVTN